MNVSPLGISSARLPVPVGGRGVATADASSPVRKSRDEAFPAERVYIGEYVAAGSGPAPASVSRGECLAARQYAGPRTDGNRQSMVQTYVQNAALSTSGGRSSGRVDYFA